jgi:hypothetical protein
MYWEHFGERKRVSRGKSKDVGAAFRDKPSEKSILAMNSGLCGRDLVGIGIGGTWVERLCERLKQQVYGTDSTLHSWLALS